MVRLRSVTFTNFSRTDWDNADIHWNTSGWSLVHVENGRKVMEMNPAVIFKTVHFTLVHELGHQRFGLADEYTSTNRCANTNHTPLNTTNLFSPNGHKLGDWVQRQNEGHTNLAASCTNCIMDQPDISEFCYRGNHNSSATNNSSGLPNWQQQASGKSCWESITATFPYLAISTNGPLPGPGAGPDTKTPLPSGASAALMVRIIPP